MKYLLSLFILTLSLNLFAEGGGHVPNGGDELRQVFHSARIPVSHDISNLSPCSFDREVPGDVVQWIVANKDLLAQDILNAPHKWTTDEQTTCALTFPRPNDPISLSFPTCLRSTTNAGAVERLLIHESIHHLGITDEEQADYLSRLIYFAPTFPSCQGESILTRKNHMVTGNFDACLFSKGQYQCLNPDGRIQGILDLMPLTEVSSLSFGTKSICYIQGLKVDCQEQNAMGFEAVSIPRHTEKVFAIYTTGKNYALVDEAGLLLWGQNPGARVSQLFRMKEFALGDRLSCAIQSGQVFCTSMQSSDHKIRFKTIGDLVNPRKISVGLQTGRACAIDDLGLACWVEGDERVQFRFPEIQYPMDVAMTSGYLCVNDNHRMRCRGWDVNQEWVDFGTPGRIENLSSQINEICYSTPEFFDCIRL